MKVTATKTTRTRHHHITGQQFPVVNLPAPPLGQGGYAPGEVVFLAGEPLYVEIDGTGEHLLCRERVALDAGNNVLDRRRAPANTDGMGAPYLLSGSVNIVGDKVVAFFEETTETTTTELTIVVPANQSDNSRLRAFLWATALLVEELEAGSTPEDAVDAVYGGKHAYPMGGPGRDTLLAITAAWLR